MFGKKAKIVLKMRLTQEPFGAANLAIGPAKLKIKNDDYDNVLDVAQSMKTALTEIGIVVAADDRFTARVLSLPYVPSNIGMAA